MPPERIARLRQELSGRARQPIPSGLVRLELAGEDCGWAAPAAVRCLTAGPAEFELRGEALRPAEVPGLDTGSAEGLTRLLARAAGRLRDHGLAPYWRDELLDVHSGQGRRIASIERGACRILGIATRSVHLNAFDRSGRLLAARRAAHKSTDPGLWDSLAGGMVAAGETDALALRREALEEAGLDTGGLALVQGSGDLIVRPVTEGLMIERFGVFDVALPPEFEPRNTDGEVSEFRPFTIAELIEALEAGEFTLEASLAAVEALQRRGLG